MKNRYSLKNVIAYLIKNLLSIAACFLIIFAFVATAWYLGIAAGAGLGAIVFAISAWILSIVVASFVLRLQTDAGRRIS